MILRVLILLYTVTVLLPRISAVNLIFNCLNSSSLIDYRGVLISALFPNPIPTRKPNSSLLLPFSTSFIFSITPDPHRPRYEDRTSGLSFLFATTAVYNNQSRVPYPSPCKIWFRNWSDQFFCVWFDTDHNHVGVYVNSPSVSAWNEAGYWNGGFDRPSFRELRLNNGENYQVWIDYLDSQINVSMARVGMRRPQRPLINITVDLSKVFFDQMNLEFRAENGIFANTHRILSWAFSNSNSSIGDALVTKNLPSFVPPKRSIFRSKRFIIGVTVNGVCVIGLVVYIVLLLRKKRKKVTVEDDWELQYWPHRFNYQEILTATNGFSDKNVIGYGGNGKVYKGLVSGTEVAVKCISRGNENVVKEFLAEVSTLGRLKHRNLVGLRGWCKDDKKSLILIYDYMENGSLDKRVFECEDSKLLSWEERIKTLKDVACGLLYLHDGWEYRVLHRDIKASNVLLDKEMVARLGDFGLARLHQHGESAETTRVVGTVGYMAPEVVRTGRASGQTDVYAFGILVLEVVCGRRPIEVGKPGLVDWVSMLMELGEPISSLDERLNIRGGFVEEEVLRVVNLALLCVHPDPKKRPVMRQILKLLEGNEIEVNLFEPMVWSNYNRKVGGIGHPTYEDIRKVSCSSIPLALSDIITEGR